MRKSRAAAVIAAFSLAAGSLVGSGVMAPTATALTPPVQMTADDLPTWQVNGVVWTLAESGGTVFAGGTFSAMRPPGSAAGQNEQEALNFVALNAATGEPTDCKLRFTLPSGTASVRELTVSPDGATLYAGGDFAAVNGTARSRLAAIDIASCSVKTGFNPGNISSRIHGLDATNDTVYLAGDFNSVGGQTRNKFAAVNATTGALTSWTANAGTDRAGRAIKATPNGQHVVLGGDFNALNGNTSVHGLAVVRADTGATVRAYTRVTNNNNLPYQLHANSNVQNMYVDDSGIYTANEGNGGGVFDGRLAMNLDFTERWRDTCLGATQDVNVYKDVLYSVSHAHNCASEGQFPELNERQHLLAESTSTDRPLHAWFPDTDDGPDGTEKLGPRALVTSTSGGKDYMWVGGEFTRISSNGNKLQQGLTRLSNGPDTRSPVSVPDNLTAANGTGGVDLKWRSSWDRDDSLLTYTIYRNGTALATKPTGSSKFWTLPTISFKDTTAKPGTTYSYQIAASDAVGNSTAKSAAVSVTTPGTPTETTLESTATADSYVNGSSINSNYGTHQQIFVRGTAPYLSYLKFDLPAAPAGMVLKSAKLTVRTTSDATAGSPDAVSVLPVTGSWSESTVTYANRPSLSSTVLGTLDGATALQTDYTVDLTTGGVAPSLNGAFDIALSSEGADALRLWARETAEDPKITLTFGTP